MAIVVVPPVLPGHETKVIESFLLLFFKKEGLLF